MSKSISAAEFKRRHMNRNGRARAESAVEVRTNIGAGSTMATKADRNRLRQDWRKRGEEDCGSFHNSANKNDTSVLRAGRASNHVRASL